jgi:hypothetical protein
MGDHGSIGLKSNIKSIEKGWLVRRVVRYQQSMHTSQ